MKEFSDNQKPLVDAVSKLTHEERMELMAVMWIGRDFDGSFEDALAYAHERSDEGDVGYITDKTLGLSAYLRTGREKVGA
ncbi:hypothetical protein OCOJLMKI_0277 [Methylobacterium iners]|uniref:DUF3775 domain-containing protein n=2 Tax=Methylobacterium iners TaxID=418707 RepID=A0ABQ4RU58_9HYPH|nr:hypothetical protein OCOJLMKI_0277 [Methylobacterium iners]